MTDETRVYVGLGTNLGDRWGQLRAAVRFMERLPDSRVGRKSSVYETRPLGSMPQGPYLNAVVEVFSALRPLQLLEHLKQYEVRAGRVPGPRWAPRVIDLDILTYGCHILSGPTLTVPHAELGDRAFVLVPLAEIQPDLCLPGHEESIQTMLEARNDLHEVRRLGPL